MVMAQYHGLLGPICACRAWLRGVDKYLAAFDSGFDEVRRLVSWDCKVPCMNNVLVNWSPVGEFADGVSLEDVHYACMQKRGSWDTLLKVRQAYDELGEYAFHV